MQALLERVGGLLIGARRGEIYWVDIVKVVLGRILGALVVLEVVLLPAYLNDFRFEFLLLGNPTIGRAPTSMGPLTRER